MGAGVKTDTQRKGTDMKHTIEFNYDGGDKWAYNSGYIITA
ncbi:hypothetical protein LCGC14_2534380, partial [marine sediment metagenome]